ncbi:MAG: hypothetical protein VX453_02990 [Acidobacteriota bacterium]|nr:hypothetical protein [Acidobacteriota bacterium]
MAKKPLFPCFGSAWPIHLPRDEITRSARLIIKNFLDILFVRSTPDGLSLPENGESHASGISWTI